MDTSQNGSQRDLSGAVSIKPCLYDHPRRHTSILRAEGVALGTRPYIKDIKAALGCHVKQRRLEVLLVFRTALTLLCP